MKKCEEHILLFIGSREDRVLGSSIAILLCVQLGAGSESEAVFKTLKPHLITVIQDQTAGSSVRASVRTHHSLPAVSTASFFLMWISNVP